MFHMYHHVKIGSGGSRITVNNYHLYGAIAASIMLDVKLRDVISIIQQEAEADAPRSTGHDSYLSQMTAGQLFCVLTIVDAHSKLKLPSGDLAAMANQLAMQTLHYCEGTEELQTTKGEEANLMGQLYDQTTCLMYMAAHAWMEGAGWSRTATDELSEKD
jgi:hypothetical protein